MFHDFGSVRSSAERFGSVRSSAERFSGFPATPVELCDVSVRPVSVIPGRLVTWAERVQSPGSQEANRPGFRDIYPVIRTSASISCCPAPGVRLRLSVFGSPGSALRFSSSPALQAYGSPVSSPLTGGIYRAGDAGVNPLHGLPGCARIRLESNWRDNILSREIPSDA